MDVKRQQIIKDLLLKEVYEKSLPAAIVFGTFSTFIFFYGFGLEVYRPYLQIACGVVMIAAILRYTVSRKGLKVGYTREYWMKMRFSVWLNAVAWSTIFALAAWELNSISIHYVVAMTLMTSFITASLITLSYDKWMYFPFQIIMLVPTIIIAVIKGEMNSLYFFLAAIITINFLYHFLLYVEYKHLLLKRFNTQVDLEVSYNAFKDQTAQLIQASKSAALGEMAGGLSHEINNSLMVILGSLRQLEKNLLKKNALDDTEEKKIRNMVTSIEKISSVIDGLRVFSHQMEPGPKENTRLADIIERSMNYSREMMKVHNIRLEVDPVPELLIYCHPIQITQILFSLIKNAYDALQRKEGDKFIKIGFTVREKKVFISICNNGPQIPDSIRSRLFQPFVTTKDVNEGTGLSLSIAMGIAKDHGGNVYLDESSVNVTFVLELPIA